MSCYTRHLKDLIEAAGLRDDREGRSALDAAVREELGMAGDPCPDVRRLREAAGTQDARARGDGPEALPVLTRPGAVARYGFSFSPYAPVSQPLSH